MNRNAEVLLEAFEQLPIEEKRTFADEILRRLRQEAERLEALRATSGSLTRAEADDMARASEDFERIG
jgi:hypothetical protein